MAPALEAVLLDRQPARAATRAHRRAGPQRDSHDHPLAAERHVPDPRPRKRQHPVECGGDSHVALLRRPLNFEHPAACRRRGGGSPSFVRNPPEGLRDDETEAQQALRARFTPRSTGEPQNRASAVLPHQPELARAAADQLPGDHQLDRRDHDQRGLESIRQARRARLPKEGRGLRPRPRGGQPDSRPVPPGVELRDLTPAQFSRLTIYASLGGCPVGWGASSPEPRSLVEQLGLRSAGSRTP